MPDLFSAGSAGFGQFRVDPATGDVRFDPGSNTAWPAGATTETRLYALWRDAAGREVVSLASVDVTRGAAVQYALNSSLTANDGGVITSNNFSLGNSARTIEFWARPDPTNPNGSHLLDLGVEADGSRFSVRIDGGKARIEVSGGFKVFGAVSSDVWRHWAIVVPTSGANVTDVLLYLNGVPQAMSLQGAKLINTATAPMSLFMSTPGLSGGAGFERYFRGMLSEVRVFDRAKTQSEVQAGMDVRAAGNETGLIALYPLNQASGSTISDLSSTGASAAIEDPGSFTWTALDGFPPE